MRWRGGARSLGGIFARALILTALTLGGWLFVIRAQERAERGGACRVSYVYDGDTVAMDCGAEERTARVVGLDTPETRDARCAEELAHGRRATERLRELVRGGEVDLRQQGYDKYGRDLVRMRVDGQDVAAQLIAEGLAVPYRGGKRPDWCARLAG